ncbi:MAG: hypothetical protein ACRETN_06120, partial [Nevskiales bacterium]
AKQQREVVNEQGLTTKTLSRQKTQEELAAEKKARDDAALAAEAKKKQDEADRNLLQTYPSVQAIDEARSERLNLIDSNLRMAQKSRTGVDESLQKLNARRAAAEKDGGKAPAPLLSQIKDHQRKLKETDDAITKMQQDRVKLSAKFDQDKKRYLELQGNAQAAVPSPAPTR